MEFVEYPLTHAVELPLRRADHAAMARLQKSTPADLHGLLLVRMMEDENTRIPIGVRLQPDPTIGIMNTMLSDTGQQPSDVLHEQSLSRLYTGDAFRAMLTAPRVAPSRHAPKSVESAITRDGLPIDHYYAQQGIGHVASYTLSDALKVNTLDWTERDIVQRLAAEVPAGMRGAFVCDITQGGPAQRQIVQSFSIAPNLVAQRLGETVLKPVAALRGDVTKQHVPDLLGIKHHWNTLALDRESLLELMHVPPSREAERSVA